MKILSKITECFKWMRLLLLFDGAVNTTASLWTVWIEQKIRLLLSLRCTGYHDSLNSARTQKQAKILHWPLTWVVIPIGREHYKLVTNTQNKLDLRNLIHESKSEREKNEMTRTQRNWFNHIRIQRLVESRLESISVFSYKHSHQIASELMLATASIMIHAVQEKYKTMEISPAN